MVGSDFLVRPMVREEVDLAIDWAASEGWNPGLRDAACFYEADSSGFLVGLLDGQPIAVISAVQYGRSFGFLGFYIVAPDYRGKGYGIQLWNAALDYLKGRTIGLDGVVAQQDNYRKSGFQLAYRNVRYEGQTGFPAPERRDVVALSELPFDLIDAYDQPFFPDERSRFLKCWITQPGTVALGILRDGRLAGYGVMRPCRSGYKIGPLFADAAGDADALFLALQSSCEPSAAIYLDTPEVNPAALALAERYRMQVVFETARMYTAPAPELPVERIFGVTTFELG